MRLTVSLPELEKGSTKISGGKKRKYEISNMVSRRDLIAIYPTRNHEGKTIAVIYPTDMMGDDIQFRPIWCKLFTACSIPKDKTTRYFTEVDFGKYMIDAEGAHKAKVTTGGNGTTPAVIRHSETLLGDLVAAPERPPLLRNLIEFIQKSF